MCDEGHKAKNLVPSGSGKPSKTGLTVLQLQKKLPKARIVYCSATGASEPKNMAYMSRLGIWGVGTQFPSFQEFIKAVERRLASLWVWWCTKALIVNLAAGLCMLFAMYMYMYMHVKLVCMVLKHVHVHACTCKATVLKRVHVL